MKNKIITLAFETAVGGGSISLLANDRVIDFWIGSRDISRAEDLLDQISNILDRNEIKKIDLLGVSTGPGSATGIRIGLATAMGLRKAFGCRVIGIPVSEAVLFSKVYEQPTFFAFPVSRRQIAWQIFDKIDREVKIDRTETLPQLIESQYFVKVVLHSGLIDVNSETNEKKHRVEILDANIASFVGLKARSVQFLEDDDESDSIFASDNVKAIYS